MFSSTEASRRDQLVNFQVEELEVQDKIMTRKNDYAVETERINFGNGEIFER